MFEWLILVLDRLYDADFAVFSKRISLMAKVRRIKTEIEMESSFAVFIIIVI